MNPPGLLISAPASGTGKTTLMLGLLAAFRAAGVTVQPFKSGPDYIDPAFHTAASGRVSVNLDTWAMGAAQIAGLSQVATGTDLVLAEGSMGLFDGVAKPGVSGDGSSADLAMMMGWPVVLILDVSGQAQTAAAVAFGCATMRPGLRLAGVVLNRVASARHEALVRAGMDAAGIRVLGALPRNPEIVLPERHLGLVQAEEQPELAAIIARAGAFVGAHVDLEALRGLAKGGRVGAGAAVRPPGQRIALARDAAFSPLADEAPDHTADVCWLPGGYPELHAGVLAGASRFRAGLGRFAETHPVHGECGGYMALGAGLVDAKGVRHEMAGLLGLETSFAKRRMHLGYRAARLAAPMPGFAAGADLRGHEFHYATILSQADAPLAEVADATGAAVEETGSRRGNVTGSFFHLIAEAP
ncbi:MAG: cobyrinate a,c-diamide synthase [Pseudomonadota bacterium]